MPSQQVLEVIGANTYLYQQATSSSAVGIDDSASLFKIVTNASTTASISSSAQFSIDPSTNGNITFAPNGSGATVCANGDLTITSGDLNLHNTLSSTEGVIYWDSFPYIHNYGTSSGGTSNIFVGKSTGNFTLTGGSATGSVAMGEASLRALTTGQGNVAFGTSVLSACTIGTFNCGLGTSSLSNLTTGSLNFAFGGLINLVSGGANVSLGVAGNNYTGAESSNITISNLGVLGESNVMRLGTSGSGSGQVNKCYLAGVDGVNVGSVSKVLTMASDQVGTATITAGAGISVTPGANTITIAATAGSDTWSAITANQTAAVNNGYFCNKAGTLALALPAASALGDVIEVANINTATGVQFTQAANQQIFIGNTSTTLGATGTLTSIAVGDSLKMVCRTANLVWQVVSMVGNWTPA